MTAAARQYSLGFAPALARLSRRDFVVAQSNAPALETLLAWLASTDQLLVVAGPPSSGKTHLLHILGEATGDAVEAARDMVAVRTQRGRIAIVDGAGAQGSPRALLSLIERAREAGARLALSGAGDPASWAQGLRDLETRLAAAARIDLADPDEALLQAVILKLLRDRQLRAGADLAAYAAARLPKTFAAADAFVAAMDAASIAEGAPVGLRLARTVIANLSEEPQPA
jgi:chromosomal replication initiation ATPase DnaA